MKIICTQENFKRAIFNCERVVSKQNTLPILNNILFEAEKGQIKISATNLEIGVVSKIGAKVEDNGRITIPAKLLGNFVNNLPAGDNVEMEIINQNIKIKSGKVKAVIKGMSAGEFPLIPQKKAEFMFQIPAFKLRNSLLKVLLCVAPNEARAELGGIDLILGAKEIFLASTDSFRLAECQIKLEEKNINKVGLEAYLEVNNNIIIPANTFSELNRIIPGDSQEMVKIILEDGQVFFEFLGTTLVSRLINGKYPEYKNIMPSDYKTKIIGEKSALLGAVKMANVFSSGKSNEIVLKIDSQAKKIFTEAKSVEAGENSTELNFEVQGNDQQIVFNAKYLLDGINSCATSKVAVLANTESTPVAIREISDTNREMLLNYTYIVMPVKN